MRDFFFPLTLIRGNIISRPNRFVMMVLLSTSMGDSVVKCYCPSTGRIGDIVFNNVPCLVSKNSGINTEWTVEAIFVHDKWIGINQTSINRHIEYFLGQGELKDIVGDRAFKREKKIGDAMIDFSSVDNFLLEVKMPLISLLNRNTDYSSFNSFDRFIKHFNVLRENVEKGNRSVVLLCYMYDAEPFVAPSLNKTNEIIHEAARKATSQGVETWQVNLSIDENKISLLKFFQLHLNGRVGVDILV